MENCLNGNKANSAFVLTSKVIFKGTFEKQEKNSDSIGEYVSTVEQTSIASKEENGAIRNSAIAYFALKNNSLINSYNNSMKTMQLKTA